MSYLSKKQLLVAYTKGSLEEVAKQVQMYGEIIGDHSWSEAEGIYKGENRVLEVQHHQLIWTVEKLNGEVIAIAFK
jgi:hypothetical protein